MNPDSWTKSGNNPRLVHFKMIKKITSLIFTLIKYYLVITATLICILTVGLPLLENLNIDSQWFYELMSRSCHQGLDRTFVIGTSPIALCSRCLGIYLGTVIGFFLIRTISFQWTQLCLALGLILIGLIEKYLELAGFFAYNRLLALIGGILLGLGLIYLVSLISNIDRSKEKF